MGWPLGERGPRQRTSEHAYGDYRHMTYDERKPLINRLQQVRGSRVLCFVLSDRETFPPGIPGFQANMASDAQPALRQLLRDIGHVDRLDFFLYTRGGATDTVWPLVCNLREHCDHLSVIVPFRAHSAGTMVCLGADEVLMSDGAELSPIDPTTGNQFNPRDPVNPANPSGINISVEDVIAYFRFAEDVAHISDEKYTIEVLKQLTTHVHPLALGNVQRVYLMIGRLARELLALHLERDEEAFSRMVTGLTTDFYTHVHAISRREAQALLGDTWVHAPDAEAAAAIDDLFAAFSRDLHLHEKYNLPDEMGDDSSAELNPVAAILETEGRSFACETHVKVMQRPQLPPNVQVQVPPGQPLPLAPWVLRTYDFGVLATGWVPNSEGV